MRELGHSPQARELVAHVLAEAMTEGAKLTIRQLAFVVAVSAQSPRVAALLKRWSTNHG